MRDFAPSTNSGKNDFLKELGVKFVIFPTYSFQSNFSREIILCQRAHLKLNGSPVYCRLLRRISATFDSLYNIVQYWHWCRSKRLPSCLWITRSCAKHFRTLHHQGSHASHSILAVASARLAEALHTAEGLRCHVVAACITWGHQALPRSVLRLGHNLASLAPYHTKAPYDWELLRPARGFQAQTRQKTLKWVPERAQPWGREG